MTLTSLTLHSSKLRSARHFLNVLFWNARKRNLENSSVYYTFCAFDIDHLKIEIKTLTFMIHDTNDDYFMESEASH